MKPPVFAYDAPGSVEEALGLLHEHADDVKVLAGGQSLIPLLNFRLSRPARLVDVNRLGELAYVRRKDGALRIGALARHAMLERSRVATDGWPVLADALALVAHPQIRNRGTVGGSVAHADPAAELPAAFAALDARFHARSVRGTRAIGWRDFFVTHLTSALEPDELLTEIEIPSVAPGTGGAFVEFARRHGDFALGGACVLITLGDDGRCSGAAVSLLAAAPTPVRAPAAEAALTGARVEAGLADEVAELVVEDIAPSGDIHGDAAYRRRLIRTLVRRTVLAAADRAGRASDLLRMT